MTEFEWLRANFKGKKVLITGHTGFKGSWMVCLLLELGAKVVGFSLPTSQKNVLFNSLNFTDKINHVSGDVRDYESFVRLLSSEKPEVVFHFAAQPLVHRSYKEPLHTLSTNVMGSVNVLEAVRNCEFVRSFVFVTSDKCYENHEWIWGYRESDQLGGKDPYSASKAAAEIIFSTYLRSFFIQNESLGAASVRAGNVIGGGDYAEDRIVPDIIRAVSSDSPITIRNPHATRPWQHVLEPLNGYLQLAAKLLNEPKSYSGSWNFGPDNSRLRTVLDVAETITGLLGEGVISVSGGGQVTQEANLLQLNCDKAKQLLNWYPKWTIDQTLQKTASWYKLVHAGEKAMKVNKHQIHEFFEKNKG